MTDFGELVNVVVDISEFHTEQTCPWHEKRQPKNAHLAPADKEEDVPPPGLPKNDGGVLGRNLSGEPDELTVRVPFSETDPRWVKVRGENKRVAEYEEDEDAEPYDVVFSAHHIIPGNEALKGHSVLRWVGDKASLGEYGKGVSSELAEGEFIGYDINSAVNGVWLPGPYALSTKGLWTDKKLASPKTVNFKLAYAFAVMDRFRRQFHYRHTDYSDFVSKCLKKLNTRLEGFIKECPVVNPNQKPEKPYRAPFGLLGMFNRISSRIRPLLEGTRWSRQIYTDNDAGPAYIASRSGRLRML